MLRLPRIAIVIVASAVLAGGAPIVWAWWAYVQPRPWEMEFEIRAGEPSGEIERRVAGAAEVLPLALRIGRRIFRNGRHPQVGWYRLTAGMSLRDAMELFRSGRQIEETLTVPEGYNLYDIVQALRAHRYVTDDDAAAFASDPSVVAELLGVTAPSLEGYLYPDTYHYVRGTRATELLRKMAARFRAVESPDWKARAAELGLTMHRVVILASVVEKETGSPDERRLIASVFHNRLRKNMRLQSDPTTIYGLLANGFDGNLTRAQLRAPTPYNTYTRYGLPVGPICNPGKDAIEAVLWPAKTDYLYFVARGNRSHYFSSSYTLHQRAVDYFQRKRGRPPPPMPVTTRAG